MNTFELMHNLWVDTHCHLYDDAFDQDREDILSTCRDELAWCIVVGDSLDNSQKALQLADHNKIYAATGVHPYHADTLNAASLDALRNLASLPQVVAIGECGLDYSRPSLPAHQAQRDACIAQWQLASQLGLPVIIHCRDARHDMAMLLREYHTCLHGGVMHCFQGDPAFVEQCVGWGMYISFAGNVTFPRAQELRDAAQAVPMDRLLIETDSPYLAPQPVRGRRCVPPYVRLTGEAVANLRGISTHELASVTAKNAEQLFLSSRTAS